MKIAVDYDGTYSADPILFNDFIRMAKMRGHEVFCVTMRYPGGAEAIAHEMPCEIIYTKRAPKIKFCAGLGHVMNIWIDDMPHLLFDNIGQMT